MATIDQQQVDESYLMKAGDILGPIKAASYKALELQSNSKILDVGCGPGIDATNIAKIAPAQHHVTGVDFDERMILAASQTAAKLGLTDKLNYQQANAYELPFEANSFCATRSERLLMHLDNPEKAIEEMCRVTKPGGKMVIIDSDWATLSSATGNDALERKLSHHLVNDMLPNGFSGRNLAGQLKAFGLENIEVSVHAFSIDDPNVWRLIIQTEQIEQSALANNIATPDEISHWHDQIAAHSAAGKFQATLCLTMATASVPE
ncbi:methyltransferase domain-containing protein [Halioxenophilus aromaticivorans]|uniref:Methyltransferase domain-containing protein n=1 Tax=Halioxenophilus aromaticivorans TaxID=1306992 RepID=A0AAV3U2G2_9ALTE